MQVLIPILVYAFVVSAYVELWVYLLGIETNRLFERYEPLLNGMLVGRELSCHDAMSLLARRRRIFSCCGTLVFRITNAKGKRTDIEKTVLKRRDLPGAFWFLMRASAEQPIAVCIQRSMFIRLMRAVRGIVHLCFPLTLSLLVGGYIAYFTLVATWWMLGAVVSGAAHTRPASRTLMPRVDVGAGKSDSVPSVCRHCRNVRWVRTHAMGVRRALARTLSGPGDQIGSGGNSTARACIKIRHRVPGDSERNDHQF